MRALLVALALCASAHAQSVLLIVADDLGVERLEVYGRSTSNANMPNVTSLASAGTVVETAWAAPVCSPTRSMLLTGRYPFRTGVGHIFSPSGSSFLHGSEVTIPEAAPSVEAAVFGKWHLADNTPLLYGLPLSQGFDTHRGTMTSFPNNPSTGDSTYFDWEKLIDGLPSQSETYATTDTVDDASNWIASRTGPWFAAVWFHAPHPPFHAPPAYLHTEELAGNPADSKAAHHRAMTEALDTELERLLQTVDLETTLVIFMGDNGTPSAAADGELASDHAKGTLYEGGVRVPMILAGSGVLEGRRMLGLVSVVDVFPTVLHGLGITPPASDGVDLLGLLRVGRPSPRDVLFTEQFKPVNPTTAFFAEEAARDERFKLIRRHKPSAGSEFYDLFVDPLETNNLLGGELTLRQAHALGSLALVLDNLGQE